MNVERATKFVKNLRMKEFCKVFDLLLSSLFKEGFVNKKPDEVEENYASKKSRN